MVLASGYLHARNIRHVSVHKIWFQPLIVLYKNNHAVLNISWQKLNGYGRHTAYRSIIDTVRYRYLRQKTLHFCARLG